MTNTVLSKNWSNSKMFIIARQPLRRVLLMVLLAAEGGRAEECLLLFYLIITQRKYCKNCKCCPRKNILLGIRLNFIGGNVNINYYQRPRHNIIITIFIMWRCVHICPLIVCPASQFSDISQIGNFPTKLTSNTFCAARKWEMLKRNTIICLILGKSGSKSPHMIGYD